MKRLLLIPLAVICLLAFMATAQQPPVEQYSTMGNVYTATALDTIHSTFARSDSVAVAKWYGPRSVLFAKSNGDWSSRLSMPIGYYIYANEPFTFKALYVGGDSTGIVQVLVDTMSVTAGVGGAGSGFKWLFPCTFHLKSPISQLRVTPAGSDSVMIVPLY